MANNRCPTSTKDKHIMITQLHGTLTSIYNVFKDLPNRPDNLIMPNAISLTPTNQVPFMAVAFLGTQPGRRIAAGGSIVTFQIQVNIQIKANTLTQEMQTYIDSVIKGFPKHGTVLVDDVPSKNLARITINPTINYYGADEKRTGFLTTITIPFTMRMD
ncbi:MAG: hypothetical protein K0U41_02020 [Gammaproteobacteria bacterium]|nr:hypothetical protein [Gammaproteobacteria bacterium]